jgi:hypothetical protein
MTETEEEKKIREKRDKMILNTGLAFLISWILSTILYFKVDFFKDYIYFNIDFSKYENRNIYISGFVTGLIFGFIVFVITLFSS